MRMLQVSASVISDDVIAATLSACMQTPYRYDGVGSPEGRGSGFSCSSVGGRRASLEVMRLGDAVSKLHIFPPTPLIPIPNCLLRRRLKSSFSPTLHLHANPSARPGSAVTCCLKTSLSIRQSQPEDNQEIHPNGYSPVKGGIVALGKFDALHIGHRELAIQASKAGSPFLLSFVGMAEVLGWEPRAPIVANCDRSRVLSTWASYCGNVAPREFQVEFSSVRSLTPRQFVEKLVKEFGVCGVVAGENYRFGYRASGDASELVRLCNEYGISAYIINPVMDKNQDSKSLECHSAKEKGQVSSTRVRYALDKGDMSYVSKLLGRHHRLIFTLRDSTNERSANGQVASVPKSCLLNLSPKEGRYDNCLFFAGEEEPTKCRVSINSQHILLEFDETCPSLDGRVFGIEFIDS